MTDDEWAALEARAVDVRDRAHAPYSGYRVGAALLDDRGRTYVGANVAIALRSAQRVRP